jgi:xylan 1,4-beta-xylosidase
VSFYDSLDANSWVSVGRTLDASILSDDYGKDRGFTGAFVGLACQDLTEARREADFDWFEYIEDPDEERLI